MPIFILHAEDANKCLELIDMSKLIFEEYLKLCLLEQQGQNFTKTYNAILVSLQELLNSEQKKYDDAKLNANLCPALIAFLIKMIKGPFVSNTESLTTCDYQNFVIRRVINRLIKKNIYNLEAMNGFMTSSFNNLLNKFESDEDEEAKSRIKDIIGIQQELESDMFSLFISNISDFNGLNAANEDLVKAKYMVPFIIPALEQKMINSHFKVGEVYIGTRFAADIKKMDDSIFMSLKNIYGIDIANEQINGLIVASLTPSKKTEVILRQSLLRAIFFLISPDIAEALKDEFIKYIEVNNMPQLNCSLISEPYSHIDSDKQKHKVISLHPNTIF